MLTRQAILSDRQAACLGVQMVEPLRTDVWCMADVRSGIISFTKESLLQTHVVTPDMI